MARRSPHGEVVREGGTDGIADATGDGRDARFEVEPERVPGLSFSVENRSGRLRFG
jgi:hypothetical protein